jgi:dihydrofolate reductase
MIAAFDENNLIGSNNKLPWNIKEDLMNFKKITSNHVVVMGRKTFESIGKALPNRRNIVITRNSNFRAEGIEVYNNLENLLESFDMAEEVFVIGGSEIYKNTLKLADRLYISHIKGKYDGDAYFPMID